MKSASPLAIIAALGLSSVFSGAALAMDMDMSMGSDPSGEGQRIMITYTNLTTGQLLSPAVFITHDSSAPPMFAEGSEANFGVMRLAEEGAGGPLVEGASLLGKAFGTANVAIPVLPGGTMSLEIEVTKDHPLITGGFMLVRTNDGFAYVEGVDAFDLETPITMDLMAWDAGTEINNEKAAYLIALMGPDRHPEGGTIQPHQGLKGDADAKPEWKFDPAKPVATITFSPLPL